MTAVYKGGVMPCFCGFLGAAGLDCTTVGVQCIRRSTACSTGFICCPNSPEELYLAEPGSYPMRAIENNYGTCVVPTTASSFDLNFDEPRPVIANKPLCEADNGCWAYLKRLVTRIRDYCVPGLFSSPGCLSSTSVSDGSTDEDYDSDSSTCNLCGQATAQRRYKTCVTEQILGMSDWSVVDIDINRTLRISARTLPPLMVNDSFITVQLVGDDTDQKIVYFLAPRYYLGERQTSYGGNLTYCIWSVANKYSRPVVAPNVLMKGDNGFIFHNIIEHPPVAWNYVVHLVEDQFSHLDGSPVSRDQFINTLVNLKGIYIRATYEDKPLETSLMAVCLDSGIQDYNQSKYAHLRCAHDKLEDAYLRCVHDERDDAYLRRPYDEWEEAYFRRAGDDREDAYHSRPHDKWEDAYFRRARDEREDAYLRRAHDERDDAYLRRTHDEWDDAYFHRAHDERDDAYLRRAHDERDDAYLRRAHDQWDDAYFHRAHDDRDDAYIRRAHDERDDAYLRRTHDEWDDAYFHRAHDERENTYLRRAHDERENTYLCRAHDERDDAYLRRAHDERDDAYLRRAHDEWDDAYFHRAHDDRDDAYIRRAHDERDDAYLRRTHDEWDDAYFHRAHDERDDAYLRRAHDERDDAYLRRAHDEWDDAYFHRAHDDRDDAYIRRAHDERDDAYLRRTHDEWDDAYFHRDHDKRDDAYLRRAYDASKDAYIRRAYDESACAYFLQEWQCPKTYRRISGGHCAETYCRPNCFFFPCQCSGHSSNCFVNVGACVNYAARRMGGHFETCIPEHRGAVTPPSVYHNFGSDCDLSAYAGYHGAPRPYYGGSQPHYSASQGYYGAPYETDEQRDRDECASNNWGLCCSGKRCTPCDCDFASESE